MNARKRLSYWRNYHRFSISKENTWTPVMQRALLQQIKDAVAVLRTQGVDSLVLNIDSIITSQSVQRVLMRMWYALFPLYANRITNQLEDEYGDELAGRKFFGTPSQHWLDIINEYILASVPGQTSEITDYTKRWIQAKIRKGIEEQMSIDEIVQLMIDSDISASRARIIARTNITTITNAASNAAARETKLLLRKVWISAQDKRTRRLPRDKFDHLHMDGVVVALNEPFNVSGELLDHPGDPKGSAGNIVQCRCTVAHEAIRDRNGRLIRNEYTTVIPPNRRAGQQQIVTI